MSKINVREFYSAGLSRPAVYALENAITVAGDISESGDVTAAGIKALYESNADTNAFTDSYQDLVGDNNTLMWIGW